MIRLQTLDLGVGFSPAIDSTIQFSELPDAQLLISAEGRQSTSSEWPLDPASPSP